MYNFIGAIVAALIGAMIAPYLSNFLDRKKIKINEKFKLLERTYISTNKIVNYLDQFNLFILNKYYNQSNSNIEQAIKEELFSELYMLFDFYLDSPQQIKEEIKNLQLSLASSWRDLAQLIAKPESKDHYLQSSIDNIVLLRSKAINIQKEIIDWIKNEKNNLEILFWTKKDFNFTQTKIDGI